MPAFSDLQTHFDELIRKGLQGSIFVKRHEDDDDEIESLVDASGLLALPTGYVDVGKITKDQGASWTRDIDTSDVMSLGYSQPSRRDIVSDVTGLEFTMQESKRQVFELYEGQDLSAVEYDEHGNISWDKPDRPATIDYRFLALFKDGDGADAIYFAKWLPRAQISDRAEQGWNEDDEIQYGVTVTAFLDSAIGTSIRTLWAAPTAVLTKMGFTAAPTEG